MGEFVMVAGAVEVGEGEAAAFDVRGERIAVAKVSGTLHAFGDILYASPVLPLGRGRGPGGDLSLPRKPVRRHERRGAAGTRQEPVRSYAVRVEDDGLQVEL